MVKKLEKIAVVLLIAFFIWVLVSWADVLCHNSPRNPSEPHDWNAFVLLTETGN